MHHVSYTPIVVWILNLSLYSFPLHELSNTHHLQFSFPIQDYGLASEGTKQLVQRKNAEMKCHL